MSDALRDLSSPAPLPLEARIERLEAENRRLRRTGRVVLALGSLGLTMSLAAPAVCKTVWGERFVLKDGRMRERLVLDGYSSDAPTLTLKDTEGGAVARLRLEADGELGLEVFRAGEPTRAAFQLVPADEQDEAGVD